MTRQRAVILEELEKVGTHPTAYEIYEMVRRRLPRISLGTVYRNLDLLASSGLIRRLDAGSGQRRFDATVEEHSHIRCTSCGRVDDVSVHTADGIAALYRGVERLTGYRVSGLEMGFTGLCPDCRKALQGQVQKRPCMPEAQDIKQTDKEG
jgi:Fur family ferric uptake transcriptional regulator